MSKTSIEWTTRTWNPTTGCTKISEGCKNCYAATMHKRLKGMGQEKYNQPFNVVRTHPNSLLEPYGWKIKDPKDCFVFVNSMSDLFHKDIPTEFIKKVFQTMNDTPHLVYQVLTKRHQRLLELSGELNWTDNIWMGVSVENQKHVDRIDYLKKTAAKVKFLSVEPLVGEITNINLEGIHQVIVGGESGAGARPMNPEWVKFLLNECKKTNTPFFFKQWGGVQKKKAGREFEGKTYDELPKFFTDDYIHQLNKLIGKKPINNNSTEELFSKLNSCSDELSKVYSGCSTEIKQQLKPVILQFNELGIKISSIIEK